MNKIRRRAGIHPGYALALFVFGWMPPAAACPIPVFQFSLEYWDSDPYEIAVHHDGDFTEAEQAAVDRLKAAKPVNGGHANISLTWRDYSRATISPPDDVELPRMEVRYPLVSGIRETLWEGPLGLETVEELLDSPIRRRIAEKLLDRNAAVWLLLKSGNRSRDRRAERLLKERIAHLEETLKVPDPGYGMDLGEIHTDIDFKMLTLDRNDPAERKFIHMLLGAERDLEEYADQPMVFPLYGRGLIMYALIGDGINEWTLTSVGEFLTGPCSCQVKQGNPGVDVLMTLDWKGQVERRTTYGMPAGATGDFLDRVDEAEERLEED